MLYPLICDPFMILLVPPLLLALYARSKVRNTFAEYSHRQGSSGATGAEAADAILRRNGLYDVTVEPVEGTLTDHYDPRRQVLRLSTSVHSSRSLVALGVAAHETAHAIQHATGYIPLKLRKGLFPIAAIGTNLGPILFMVGFIMLLFKGGPLAEIIAKGGILLFGAGAFFTVITLPVEFNASKRALVMLTEQGLVSAQEREHAKRVLDAAALTYVAAAFVAITMLLRFILRLFAIPRDE